MKKQIDDKKPISDEQLNMVTAGEDADNVICTGLSEDECNAAPNCKWSKVMYVVPYASPCVDK